MAESEPTSVTVAQQTVLSRRTKPANADSARISRTISMLALLGVGALSAAGNEPQRDGLPLTRAGSDDARENGEALYMEHCATCHKKDGSGYVTVIPPLADSDFIAADVRRLVSVVVDGLSGPITVNGLQYEGVMPAMRHLPDAELAMILNYVLRRWGGSTNEFSPEEIGDYREAARSDRKPSTTE